MTTVIRQVAVRAGMPRQTTAWQRPGKARQSCGKTERAAGRKRRRRAVWIPTPEPSAFPPGIQRKAPNRTRRGTRTRPTRRLPPKARIRTPVPCPGPPLGTLPQRPIPCVTPIPSSPTVRNWSWTRKGTGGRTMWSGAGGRGILRNRSFSPSGKDTRYCRRW